LIGEDGSNFLTTDGGATWNEFFLPEKNVVIGVSFNTDKDKLMIKGNSCAGEICSSSMYYTLDGLKTFNLLLDVVDTCVWEDMGNTIYCTKWTDPSQYGDRDSIGLKLLSSNNYFSTEKTLDLGGAVVGLKYVKGFTLAAVVSLKSSHPRNRFIRLEINFMFQKVETISKKLDFLDQMM
jgi:hypothetical protein